MLSFNQQHILDGFDLSRPFLLLLLSLISLYFLAKLLFVDPSSLISNKKLPPSPPKLPISGNLHQLSLLAHRSLQSLGTKYGPLMLLHFGYKPAIIVQSANAAREIMKTNDLIFADKPHTRTARRLFYNLKDISVAPYGEYWRKLKSICILQLLSSKRVQSFGFIREEETALLMGKIKSCFSSKKNPVNLSELFVSITNDVVCRAVFGRKYSEEEEGKKFLMLMREVLELMGNLSIGEFMPWLSWISYVNGFDTRVDKVAREVDDFLEMVIFQGGGDDHQVDKDESKESFVDILMDLYKESEGGVSIDRDGIKAIILDIIVGGTDTPSATLEWTMSELLRHPTVLKNLQNEVRENTRGETVITENDLGNMHYLKAVVKETFRLHPPIPFMAREARENVNVMGYDFSIGTMIVINSWAIGRDPHSWYEPEKFMPERFLTSSIDFKGLDFELIPFGSGRRGCPGVAFAMAAIELVLANLVQKFDWELPKGTAWEDLDMTEQPGITIHRKNPLLAVATRCYF